MEATAQQQLLWGIEIKSIKQATGSSASTARRHKAGQTKIAFESGVDLLNSLPVDELVRKLQKLCPRVLVLSNEDLDTDLDGDGDTDERDVEHGAALATHDLSQAAVLARTNDQGDALVGCMTSAKMTINRTLAAKQKLGLRGRRRKAIRHSQLNAANN